MNEQFQHRADEDFFRARIHETMGKIFAVISNKDETLLPFSKVKSAIQPKSEKYKGVKPVRIDSIVGSEDRYEDFDKQFLPSKKHLEGRWKRVDLAYYEEITLPPIRLYEISGVYFVRDGNHRISVARAKGVEFIDAEITTLDADIKLDPKAPLKKTKESILLFERERFCGKTGIGKLRPETDIVFTEIGRYEELHEHINVHKYYINLELPTEIPFETALLSWHDNVYIPIVEIINRKHILSRFPNRTDSDLYVWTIMYWDDLKKKYGQDFPLHKAIKNFSSVFGSNVLQRLFGALRSFSK
jgi:hypothetical protein